MMKTLVKLEGMIKDQKHSRRKELVRDDRRLIDNRLDAGIGR